MSNFEVLPRSFVKGALSLRAVFAIVALILIVAGTPQASLSADSGSDRSPEVLIQLAEKGDPQAQFDLGVTYYYGRGVPKDYEKASHWFQKAADQGNAAAQYALGRMYYYGRGMRQDLGTASTWFQKSADKGYGDAQFALGVMYQFGKGIDMDLARAAQWYRKAADSGVAAAQYALGAMYSLGQGGVKDVKEALKWLRKAAEQNYGPPKQTLVIIEPEQPDRDRKIKEIQITLGESL